MQIGSEIILSTEQLQTLLDELNARDFETVGPTVRDAAIVLDTIRSLSQLPVGWTDQQDNGSYRLTPTDSPALFDYTCGPQSWKKFLHPSECTLSRMEQKGRSFEVGTADRPVPRRAFLGVRPCELKALALHDRALSTPPYADPVYTQRRNNAMILAVNCTRPGGTCFCASMGTGPGVTEGFDLALTELTNDGDHRFVVEIGTEAGLELVQCVSPQPASEADCQRERELLSRAEQNMGRTVPHPHLRDDIPRYLDSPQW